MSRAPAELRTDEFLLRPIRASDAELDYEAVMESKEFLRGWEQTGWPDDDFTVDANREDLIRLERRHADGESFTYTVMGSAEASCLGCVYVFPTSARLFTKAGITAADDARWSDYELVVYFWVRGSRLRDELDRRLLGALDHWLRQEWRVEHYLVVTSERFEQQVALIESTGRRKRFEIAFTNKPGKELAYSTAVFPG